MHPDDVQYFIRKGLGQIPKDGLQRLLRYIDSGRSLLLTGQIVVAVGQETYG